MNELKDYLKREGMMTKRDEEIRNPDSFLLPSPQNSTGHETSRRWQHIFKGYVEKLDCRKYMVMTARGDRYINIPSIA